MHTTKPYIAKSFSLLLAPLSFLMVATLFTGCQSTYVKSDTAAYYLQDAANDVRMQSRNLETTVKSLNDLIATTEGDLRLQYQLFDRSLNALISSSKGTSGTSSRLASKRDAYFKAWDKQILAMTDEEIRKQSQARKLEVANQHQAATRQYQEAQNALAQLINYLGDIRKSLNTDLTSAGLQAAKSAVNVANERAAKIQPQLAESATALDALGNKMSSYAAGQTK